jgi:Uma2 family endonuclease
MVEKTTTISIPQNFVSGTIVATEVSEQDYMRDYAQDFCEWVKGAVIKMPPILLGHNHLSDYLRDLLKAYFALRPIGQVISAPFVMRLENSRREPDLQVILKDNSGTLTETYMDGAADICIEVVSPSNAATDYGDKFTEYEAGGVKEYWIIDSMREECRFHRLNEDKLYKQILPVEDIYTTPLLPKFKLHVPTLWKDELPNFFAIAEIVKVMVGE